MSIKGLLVPNIPAGLDEENKKRGQQGPLWREIEGVPVRRENQLRFSGSDVSGRHGIKRRLVHSVTGQTGKEPSREDQLRFSGSDVSGRRTLRRSEDGRNQPSELKRSGR